MLHNGRLRLGRVACRAERLEIFDEFEEWNMIQVRHAARAQQSVHKDELLR